MKISFLLYVLVFCGLVMNGQTITTFAGGGLGGDGISATSARLINPGCGSFDKEGNVYFVEFTGHKVRKIDATGIISTVAGNGSAGYSGDGGPATNAALNLPGNVVLDTAGNIFIADQGNNRIRMVNNRSGIISSIAGTGIAASLGDGFPATAASLNTPTEVTVDKSGCIYIGEGNGAKIRKIDSRGIITTFAGNGRFGLDVNGRADTSAIGSITSLCIDNEGKIYALSESNLRIFKIDNFGYIRLVAGTGSGFLFNGDDILGTSANIDAKKICVDRFGNLFIAENQNYRVRYVDQLGYIHTAAGNGTRGFSGDGGAATAAQFSYPSGVAFDSCNNLYIAEANNNRIRKVTYPKCNYLAVEETHTTNDLTIYPNPANELLNINIPVSAGYRLADAAGRVLLQGPLSPGNNQLPIHQLAPGMYLLMVESKEGSVVKKIVKE